MRCPGLSPRRRRGAGSRQTKGTRRAPPAAARRAAGRVGAPRRTPPATPQPERSGSGRAGPPAGDRQTQCPSPGGGPSGRRPSAPAQAEGPQVVRGGGPGARRRAGPRRRTARLPDDPKPLPPAGARAPSATAALADPQLGNWRPRTGWSLRGCPVSSPRVYFLPFGLEMQIKKRRGAHSGGKQAGLREPGVHWPPGPRRRIPTPCPGALARLL
ncbi:hypothetical protein MC885_002652 [Smutsia gigantea]|nr:hypothetical protein MC885_002652 [Smutsia gigantea]